MSCERQSAGPDRKAACRECRRNTNHRVVAQHDYTENGDFGIVWNHHALLECRGCGTFSYEYSYEFSDNLDQHGNLYTTRHSYPSRDDELPEGLVVVLMTDIVNSTELTEELGDVAFRARADKLHDKLLENISFYKGKPAEGNVLGDGVLAVFTSAAYALACAIECVEIAHQCELRLHVGVHAGDVLKRGQTVYGGTVNITARVTTLSDPDEVLVTDTICALARTSTASLQFEPRGTEILKGIREPLQLYVVTGDEAWRKSMGVRMFFQ
jgi:class 3 adenylate cyclase